MKASEPHLPLVEELVPAFEPEVALLRMSRLPHCLFLDSALRHPVLGRYSFLAADPFDFLEYSADGSDALAVLADHMAALPAITVPGLPPFQGGAAGLFGYELGRSLETVPSAKWDECRIPALAVGLYDLVVAFDHVESRAWVISQGWPETEPGRRRRRAEDRLAQARQWLGLDGKQVARDSVILSAAKNLDGSDEILRCAQDDICVQDDRTAFRQSLGLGGETATAGLTASGAQFGAQPRQECLPARLLAPQYPIANIPGITSNFSKQGYLAAVQQAIDFIYAGDVFQVNLAQRLLTPARGDAVSLYQRLRRRNPAPMAGYFDLGEFQIVSASPERFVKVSGGRVETRPIKGTRRRIGQPVVDCELEAELLASEKDRAENVMIVDLMRNDLSRVCTSDSVQVTQLCGVETYEYVMHLVSAVCGQLREACSPLDLLRAAFPGGSITGAPKLRAMEIIAELEPTARGAYCGSLGYVAFDGSADLSILIRTITAGRGWWQFPVGGGIVAQSDPEQEYEETWHKAEGLLRALGSNRSPLPPGEG